jgi:Ino eighty subunit 1
MRAQLRTYHAIPSLQAHQDPNSYKQLQDSPRLKSIIKGALEDRPEPKSLDKIKIEDVPRTNPVNLVSVLAQSAPKVTELHFPANGDFYDLIMKEDVSSTSRALSFLWLMWFYLESDFTEEGADENPFGPGVDYDLDVRNQGVPEFEILTKEQQELENVDTPEEKNFGNAKMRERKRIIEADQAAAQAEHRPPKRGHKAKLHVNPVAGGTGAPLGRSRFTPPPQALGDIQIQSNFNSDPRFGGSPKHEIVEGPSSLTHQGETVTRKPRPLTAHQLAAERNRNQRLEYILRHGLRQKHHVARKQRLQGSAIWRALQRTKQMVNPFDDSEGEEDLSRENLMFKARGFGGLVQLEVEEDDFGEEMSAYAAALRRTSRRLDRWDSQKDSNLGVNRVLQTKPADINHRDTATDSNGTEDERHFEQSQPKAVRDVYTMDEEDLDDMDKEMLGLVSEAEEDIDEDLEDIDEDLEDIDEDLEDIDDEGLEPLQNSDYSTRVMEIARLRGEQAPSQVDR